MTRDCSVWCVGFSLVAPLLRRSVGFVAPQYVGSLWTKDHTHVLYTGRRILNHQTIGEPHCPLFKVKTFLRAVLELRGRSRGFPFTRVVLFFSQEPTYLHTLSSPSPQLPFGFILGGVCSVSLDKCVMTRVHRCNITQGIFMVLQSPVLCLLLSSPTPRSLFS